MVENIKAIGRIETDYLPGYTWVGTGFLITEDLLITNRHVARLFAASNGKVFSFQSFLNRPVEPRIDYLAEHQSNYSAEFKITECVFIASDKDPDVAVFRVDMKNDGSIKPITIHKIDFS